MPLLRLSTIVEIAAKIGGFHKSDKQKRMFNNINSQLLTLNPKLSTLNSKLSIIMATIIITLILCAITAAVTFIFTRSLYINHYKDWYRTAVESHDIDTESEQAAEQMYETLASKHASIFQIDHTIIPEYVKRTFEWGEDDMTKLNIIRVCRAARWLGYDLTLTKRQLPPPPKFNLTASPSAIREEWVECMEAEARLEKAD